MDKRQEYIDKYNELKKLKSGEKPLRNEFLKHFGINEIHLTKIFGKDPYSTLQEAAGDSSNKLPFLRTELSQILNQYGELTRQYQRIPVQSDWYAADFYPRPDGLRKVHKISFLTLPEFFITNYKDKPEWKDVLKILHREDLTITASRKRNKTFDEIVGKINAWTPDRKRVLEEGYKIELRKYLEKYFDVEEEVGDTNTDLLLNKKFPIEIKKDPTLSEYDRLLGQMIRHNKQYGNAIAVVTSLSSQDRFMKFQKLFDEIHTKLGMTAEIINK
ncbi:MAG: hypothetical protein HOO86_05285 [Bacteroidales bacterium]|nr:hypothetical protein [Bacteroidales bacterium]